MNTFDPTNPPKGFPPDGIQMLNRKPYVTHVGLVWLANQRGKPWSSTIDHPSPIVNFDERGLPVCAVVISTVSDGECSHTAVGDCSVESAGAKIAPHLIRMAGTRAKNRALRLLVGYAGTTADEIDLDAGRVLHVTKGDIGYMPNDHTVAAAVIGDGYPETETEFVPPHSVNSGVRASDEVHQKVAEAIVKQVVSDAVMSCDICDKPLRDNCEKKARSWDDNARDQKTGDVGAFVWNGPLFGCTAKDASGDFCKGAFWWASKVPPGPWWVRGGPLEFIAQKQGTNIKSAEVTDAIPF